MQIDNHKFAKLLACIHISPAKDKLLFIYLICSSKCNNNGLNS